MSRNRTVMNRRAFASRLKRIEQEYSEMLARISGHLNANMIDDNHPKAIAQSDWLRAAAHIQRATRSNAVAIIKLERHLKGKI